jgi:hypothetical protein
MLKPSTPQETLRRLLTRQGSGKFRRLRKGATAKELADAIAIVRIKFPEAKCWLNAVPTGLVCSGVIGNVLGHADRVPDRRGARAAEWDLVGAWMRKTGVEDRAKAVQMLGLPTK